MNFWYQVQTFLFFRKILQLDKFEGTDYRYDNSFLKLQPKNSQIMRQKVKNTQLKHFWSKIQKFFFRDILELDKFQGADFKYDKIIFKFQHSWSQIQAFLLFREIMQIDKFEGADFKYDNSTEMWQQFFKILAQKYLNKVFSVPNLDVFVFP